MRFLDYAGESAPSSILASLRRPGLTEGGLPYYRLVQSDKVLEKAGQSWEDWGDYVPVEDRGALVTGEDGKPAVDVRPLRTVVEVREVQKYPHLEEGSWVLERLMPAYLYGSEQEWYAAHNCVPGTSVPLLGPFPEGGRYEMIAGPFPLIPSASFLEDQIAFWEAKRAEIPRDVEKHVRQRVYEAQCAEETRQKKLREEQTARILDSVSPLVSSSLAAGRWRTKMAERGGMRSHIGN